MKLIPDLLIELGCTTQPLAPTCGNSGVKAGEIDQLHRQRRWRSADKAGELNDLWITLMQPAKRQLAVQMECQFQLVSAPAITTQIDASFHRPVRKPAALTAVWSFDLAQINIAQRALYLSSRPMYFDLAITGNRHGGSP
jgi:hypothetical protein